MSVANLPEEERFSKNIQVLGFLINSCITSLNEAGKTSVSPVIVNLGLAYLNNLDHHVLIRRFISKTHLECWDMIHQRNLDFFYNHADKLFSGVPGGNVSLLKTLFDKNDDGKMLVTDTQINNLWKNFEALVRISIKYAHKYSGPVTTADGEKTYQKKLTNGEDELDIDLLHHAEVWNLTLNYPSE